MSSNKEIKKRKLATLDKELRYWEKQQESATWIGDEDFRLRLTVEYQKYIDATCVKIKEVEGKDEF